MRKRSIEWWQSLPEEDIRDCDPAIAQRIGSEFGKLTIVGIGRAGRTVDGVKVLRHYECKCTCGATTFVPWHALKSGNTKSCGCINRTADGRGDWPEYKVWREMLRRCENPTHKRFHEWGGRGISVCDRWHDFDLFLEDMGFRPSAAHSIERVDNDEGYAPNNCVWATRKQQANNQSSNKLMTLGGKVQSMAKWADELNLPYSTIRSRKNNLGWTDEKALTTPIRRMLGVPA